MRRASWQRMAILGYGSIADEIIRSLELRNRIHSIKCTLVRSHQIAQAEYKAKGRFRVVSTLPELFQLCPDVVIEAAGQTALFELGPQILAHGIDLIASSVGTLARHDFREVLLGKDCKAGIWIPSGAIAGIDGLLASRTAGLTQVSYTSLKPPPAWEGTVAESALRAASKRSRAIFFRGTARDAAIQFPKNANVAATIAFAGLGLDRTMVTLGSDSEVDGPLGLIDASGTFGSFHFEILGLASAANPKSSLITGHSIATAAIDGFCFKADVFANP